MIRAIPFFTIFIAFSCFAQEKPKAIQIDEFGKITCEDLLARADNFAYRLSKEPNASGVVVLLGREAKARHVSWYTKLITEAVFMRESVNNSVTVFLDETRGEIAGELWIVPPGAEQPNFPGKIIARTPPDLSARRLLGTDSGDNICSTFSPKGFADILKKYPHVRGHIVILNMSRRDSVESAMYWRKLLTGEHNLPKNKVKITFKRKGSFPETEFWSLPIRKI